MLLGCSAANIAPGPEFEPVITARADKSLWHISFQLTATGKADSRSHIFMKDIVSADIIIQQQDSFADTLQYRALSVSGTAGPKGQSAATMYQSIIWEPSKEFDPSAAELICLLNTHSGTTYRTKRMFSDIRIGEVKQQQTRPLETAPIIEIMNSSKVVFGIETKRNWIDEEEYFPTSQNVRAVLKSKKGKVLWSSDHNMNFLQVISKPEPAVAGAIHRYTVEWNGNTNNGTRLAKGEYILLLELKVRPEPYLLSPIDFIWKESDE